MLLSNLYTKPGTKKRKHRLGRGDSSGHGKTSGRGHKGLFSRSGGKLRHGFEGGQMPLIRRIPKRGFNRIKSRVYQVVNIDSLNKVKADGAVSPEEMKKHGLIKNASLLVKVLGTGDLAKPLKVSAHAFSKSASKKIKASGGEAIIISKQPLAAKQDQKKKDKTKKD